MEQNKSLFQQPIIISISIYTVWKKKPRFQREIWKLQAPRREIISRTDARKIWTQDLYQNLMD